MNPLKNLFNKVFESTPPVKPPVPANEGSEFEWNPDDEPVAPTSARAVSWRREPNERDENGDGFGKGEASVADISESAQALPVPTFEHAPTPPRVEDAPVASVKTMTSFSATETAAAPVPVAPAMFAPARPHLPLSDFEDVYRKAGIKSPVHGYGVERVYRLITSRRLVGLDQSVRRSALLTALDAAGVPASDVSQDAVLRRKALTAYEAEKALELQSLRSRNESRAEALQDTVETFTRQKQSQIERLAQGSTSAVRAQSDLEIRKRMEQDRLFRSLAYFVEALPPPEVEARGAVAEAPKVVERFDATIEMSLPAPDEIPAAEPEAAEPEAVVAQELSVSEAEVVTVTPEEMEAETRPISLSSVDMTLRGAANEIPQDTSGQTEPVVPSAGSLAEASPNPHAVKKAETKS